MNFEIHNVKTWAQHFDEDYTCCS